MINLKDIHSLSDFQRTQILRNYYVMGTTQVRMEPLPWPWSDARNRGRGNGRINSAPCYP